MTSVSGVPCDRDLHPLGECPRHQMCAECGEFTKDCDCRPGTVAARADRRPPRRKPHRPPYVGYCATAPHRPGVHCYVCAERTRRGGVGASIYANNETR